MWRFIKNLFKREKKMPHKFSFNYDKETEVICEKHIVDGVDEWDITINTTKDLEDRDFMRIIASVKKRTD